ncbi:PREDICTED: uncharacterized protein LOC109158044 [Ipomoea nil]|uniref:uncharacterized protein LOC109158044 n=1 Tax=Ipomoea nil TaxID=35883 RepID=UPI00090107CA|nr:PREDICTED: uncharacterized protein LOC109158044 [Ipomoea nil]
MAKMITQRMKPLMEGVISDTQSAFIPNRLITDNILIEAEVGHFLNRKQCGIGGWGALKLDMAKAYDRMEWPFLKGMLKALGFDERWVDLIMLCVTTVSYRFLVNGSPTEAILPTRGLRQGDPLSPYLFIICAEGLSLLLQQAQANGVIHGCRVARAAPPVSHLFFADDSLLFFKANVQEASEIKNILTTYESLSGQMVNYQKSSICYSKNTSGADRDIVAQTLGVVQAPNFGKYLGLPAFVGKNKKMAFAYIEDKIKQRIGSWNKKLLTQAGKEILLKSKYGGLGFKDLRAFNLAMLGKQAWKFLTNPESLVARIYKARYFHDRPFNEACLGNNPSYCWRSIMAAKDLIIGGVRRRVGNGNSTLIWKDPWLQDEMDPMIQTEMPPQLIDAKVSGLIDQTTGTWDPHILSDIFDPSDVPRILKIPISPEYDDTWYWYDDPNGCYSVKNGYRHVVGIYESSSGFDKWDTIWKLRIPPKWRMFLWRAISNILPTTNNLLIKRVDVDPICAMCGLINEDLEFYTIFGEPGTERYGMHAYTCREELCYQLEPWLAVRDVTAHRTSQQPAALPAVTFAAPLPSSPSAIGSTVTLPHSPTRQEHSAYPKQCYVDAGYNADMKIATAGILLLDHIGRYVSAYCVPPQACFSPLMAETLACKEALSWLKQRGEQVVQIYTDCQTLRTNLESSIQPRSYLGYVLDECRRLIATFNFVSVIFIPRSQNVMAHDLASDAFIYSTPMYWDGIPPDSISIHI